MSRRLTVAVAAAALLLTAGAAVADPGSTTRDGMTLTVSKAEGLRVEGEKVRVRGSGYDREKGIYVAFCVDNGPGKVPTPCGGGADTEGSSGNSVWISDFPPAYGTGLARPYGDGGSFDVEISVRALLRSDDPETEQDETVDCRRTRCAVVTRNDHTRSDDRSQDVAVPIAFATTTPGAPAAAPAPADASGPAAPAAGTSGGTSGATEPAGAPGSPAALDAAVAAGTTPSTEASPGASVAPAPLVADEGDAPVAAAGPVAVPASAGGDGSLLLPLLLAGGLAAAGGASALLWRRRAGTAGHA